MKFLIASDIHGSARWCQALFAAFAREQPDRLLLLGDLLYHGPRNDLPDEYDPKAVLAMLNEKKAVTYCVRGNCDSEVDQMVLQFPILADSCLLSVGKRLVFATHGHVYNEEHLPPLHAGDVLLHGHTHVPVCARRENHLYMNPGSVAIPKDGSAHSYMTLEDGLFLWKTMEGEIFLRCDLSE